MQGILALTTELLEIRDSKWTRKNESKLSMRISRICELLGFGNLVRLCKFLGLETLGEVTSAEELAAKVIAYHEARAAEGYTAPPQ